MVSYEAAIQAIDSRSWKAVACHILCTQYNVIEDKNTCHRRQRYKVIEGYTHRTAYNS